MGRSEIFDLEFHKDHDTGAISFSWLLVHQLRKATEDQGHDFKSSILWGQLTVN